MKTKIKNFESYFCFCVWTFSNIYSLYKLIEAQSNILQEEDLHSLRDLQPGWPIISRFKDVSDIEWNSWKYFFHTSWYYLILQFFISEIIRRVLPSCLKFWYITSTVIFITMRMGLRQMLIISAQPMIYALIVNFGGNKLMIWLTSILLLLSYNSLKYKYFFWKFLDHDDMQDEEVYLILFSVAWIELRCISYSIDFIEKRSDQKKRSYMSFQDIVNLFSYVLYLPVLYTGPIILYEEFERSFNVRGERCLTKVKRFIWNMMFYMFYTICMDIAFHYIYFFSMQDDMELIRKLPSIALCGGGLFMGLQFHMKYVISYGTTSAFARLDDMDPPPTPRCIARVHVYSQMWRHFDVGLYRFLVKYIYKPGYDAISKHSLPRIAQKLLASLATFTFIFMWHGTVWHILIWSFLNYLGIALEHLGMAVSKHNKYLWFKSNILKTEKMEARFIAILCTPLLALSAVSNFYLFAGSEVGNLFFECFSQPSLLNSFLLSTTLYCCCQVSMALEDVPSRGSTKKCDNIIK